MERSGMDPTIGRLLSEADEVLRGSEWPRRLARIVPGLGRTCLDLTIHPRDQMLLHSLVHHRDVDAALSQYFAISLQQLATVRQVLQALHPGAAEIRFLDFACGYGRLLRFLDTLVPRRETWASEIQADALAFVTQRFGVRGVSSHADPERFEPFERFEMIWVASLFSHLPERLFDRWLERLVGLLSERGALCFSVRDVSQLPDGIAAPASGLLYASESENAELDSSIYGTAYASEAFVARSLEKAAPGCPWVRIPRALANEQDLYVVSRDPAAKLEAVRLVRRGPWGWVDVRSMDSSGRVDLQGWAASLDDGEVDHVCVNIGGSTSVVRPTIERPDVMRAFDDARMARAGWACSAQAVAPASSVEVEVTGIDREGAQTILYAGTLRESGDTPGRT